MGLDWCLRALDEKKSPLELIGAERMDPNNPKHVAIAREIIDSHVEYIKNSNRHPDDEYEKYWTRTEEEIFKDMAGLVLVDTVPEEVKAVALQSLGSMFSSLSGVEAFRGKRIQLCPLVEENNDDLINRAFEEMDQNQMSDYADALEDCLPSEENLDFDYDKVENELEKDDQYDPPELYLDIKTIKEACAWLRFWSEYPVRMVPWY